MDAYQERYFTSRDGLKLYYRDYPGPQDAPFTVLCIPGLTRSSLDFAELAPHLAARYRVLACDLRGRGRSDYAADPKSYVPQQYVQDIIQLLGRADVEKVVCLGTSLGGIITMIAAGILGERMIAAILNDIGPEIDQSGVTRIRGYVGASAPHDDWQSAVAATEELGKAAFPHYGPEDWDRMARKLFVEKDGRYVRNYDLRIADAFSADENAAPDALWPFFTALAGRPVLVIRGETSDILSAETLQEMEKNVPGLESVTVPGVGHAPMLDEPAALQAIDAFLDEVAEYPP